MSRIIVHALALTVVASLGAADLTSMAHAQSKPVIDKESPKALADELRAIKKDLEALKEGQKAIRKDLQEIKQALSDEEPDEPPPPPVKPKKAQ